MTGKMGRPTRGALSPSPSRSLAKAADSALRASLGTLREVARRSLRDRVLFRSAALSYFTLLSLLPLAALFLFAASRTAFLAGRLDRLEAFLVGQLVTPAARGLAEELVDSLRSKVPLLGSGVSGFLALLLVLALAASLIVAVVRNLREILHASPAGRPSFAGVLLLGAGLLLPAAAFTASVVLGGKARLPPPLRLLLPFLLTVTGFYFLYAVLPGVRIGPGAALKAAASAGLLWEAAKVGLSLYASLVFSSSVVGRLYGSLSLFPVALLWIYYSWALVLLGAEAAAVLNEGSRRRREPEGKGRSGNSAVGGTKIPPGAGA